MGAIEWLAKHTSWYAPPKRPGTLDRIQMITSAVTLGCGDIWHVYIETLKRPAALALLAYFDFGLMDVWRGFYKPRDAMRGSRRSPISRARRRRGFDFDLGDWIGKQFRPDEFANRPITDGQRHLWRLSFAIERALWWWMVIDIAWDFAYDWASEIHRAAAERSCYPYRAAWREDDDIIPFANQWFSVDPQIEDYSEPPMWGYTGGIVVPPGYVGGCSAACIVTAANPLDPPVGARTAILDVTNSGDWKTVVSTTGTDRADGSHHTLFANLRGGREYKWMSRRDGGGAAKLSNLTFVAWARPA